MLVDTSVWVEHLRRGVRLLRDQLEEARVWTHPFVIGEVACGNLSRRCEVLGLLAALPEVPVADHAEVLAFVEAHRLAGCGLGWVDMHLLASAKLASMPLWTRDVRLEAAAGKLGLAVAS